MYPENCRLFIDGRDITKWAFGSFTITPTLEQHSWNNIDITQFVKGRGTHIIEVTAEAGVGRVEIIVEIA